MEKHPKLKINRSPIDYQDEVVFDIYNRVISPMDQSIDWMGYFTWAQIKGVEDIEFTADLMLLIRHTHNEYNNTKEERKKSIEQSQKQHNDLLKKKFGG